MASEETIRLLAERLVRDLNQTLVRFLFKTIPKIESRNCILGLGDHVANKEQSSTQSQTQPLVMTDFLDHQNRALAKNKSRYFVLQK